MCLEILAGILVQRPPWASRRCFIDGGIGLRHLDIDAKHLGRRQVKQFGRRGPGPGANEVADIGVARGDDAVKRRIDIFVTTAVAPAAATSAWRDATVDLIGVQGRGGVVALLGRDRLVFSAGSRCVGRLMSGQFFVRLRRHQISPRLAQLMIQLGRLDLGEQLALIDVGTDVDIPYKIPLII